MSAKSRSGNWRFSVAEFLVVERDPGTWRPGDRPMRFRLSSFGSAGALLRVIEDAERNGLSAGWRVASHGEGRVSHLVIEIDSTRHAYAAAEHIRRVADSAPEYRSHPQKLQVPHMHADANMIERAANRATELLVSALRRGDV